ncbi:hypothetical protein ILYODFUR_031110 [Ilyodon furcidens]|uniref:AIG1-type G domain-containing protein n=1 Tax=Ilyodon furcidens TaxID=33524 RepID=A0ABV0UXW2_9TELE
MSKRKANSGLQMDMGRAARLNITDPDENYVTILLIGKTGTGKSSAANMCIEPSRSQFGENPLICEKKIRLLRDCRTLAVIDTPGLFHTTISAEEMKREMARCVSMCAPGPNVFLIVIEPKRFSREEQDMVEIIKKMFGDEATRYTMVLITHGDEMEADGVSAEKLLYFNSSFNEFVSKCLGGYHVFNNNECNSENKKKQVNELVEKIDRMVQRNGGLCYTNEMFREAQRAIDQEMFQMNGQGEPIGSRDAAERNNSFVRAVEQTEAVGLADVVKGVRAVREAWCKTQ